MLTNGHQRNLTVAPESERSLLPPHPAAQSLSQPQPGKELAFRPSAASRHTATVRFAEDLRPAPTARALSAAALHGPPRKEAPVPAPLRPGAPMETPPTSVGIALPAAFSAAATDATAAPGCTGSSQALAASFLAGPPPKPSVLEWRSDQLTPEEVLTATVWSDSWFGSLASKLRRGAP